VKNLKIFSQPVTSTNHSVKMKSPDPKQAGGHLCYADLEAMGYNDVMPLYVSSS
jgi:hypothetical protein